MRHTRGLTTAKSDALSEGTRDYARLLGRFSVRAHGRELTYLEGWYAL
jgi:hypothetical protein